MSFIEWLEKYNTGIPDIDKDHQGLFALINDLHDKVELGSAEASIKVTIEALADYVDYHFEREEALMKACDYADIENHKAGHRKLQSQVESFQDSYERDPVAFNMTDFMAFLTFWIESHILQSDMAYVPDVSRHVERWIGR